MKNNTILILTLFCGVLATTLFPRLALADCTQAYESTITPPALVIQRDVPVGTTLATVNFGSKTIFGPCYKKSGESNTIYFGISGYIYAPVMTIDGLYVFSTGTAGIGYSLGASISSGYGFVGNATSGSGSQGIMAGSYSNLVFSTANTSTSPGYVSGNAIIRFIKTGDISGSATIAARQVGSFIYSTAPAANGPLGSPTAAIRINGFSVKSISCSLQTTSINVALDPVLSSSLGKVGTTANPKSFNLGLNCDPNANISVKINGTQDTDTTADGVLKVNSNTASGVGIQLLYAGNPFKLNNQANLKTSAGGTELLTFTARYYQTKAKVVAGNLNATATLDITYQ